MGAPCVGGEGRRSVALLFSAISIASHARVFSLSVSLGGRGGHGCPLGAALRGARLGYAHRRRIAARRRARAARRVRRCEGDGAMVHRRRAGGGGGQDMDRQVEEGRGREEGGWEEGGMTKGG